MLFIAGLEVGVEAMKAPLGAVLGALSAMIVGIAIFHGLTRARDDGD